MRAHFALTNSAFNILRSIKLHYCLLARGILIENIKSLITSIILALECYMISFQ